MPNIQLTRRETNAVAAYIFSLKDKLGIAAGAARRQHDPKKWIPVFGKDHTQTKS
jgi:hypothetical protein